MQTNALARARTHLLAYIRSRTEVRSRRGVSSYRERTATYTSVRPCYTFAVIGYRLSCVLRQLYGAQPDSLGMWVAYRNRALSDPRTLSIPLAILNLSSSSAFRHCMISFVSCCHSGLSSLQGFLCLYSLAFGSSSFYYFTNDSPLPPLFLSLFFSVPGFDIVPSLRL